MIKAIITGLFFLFSFVVESQTTNVYGNVKTSHSETLAAATILIENTSFGVQSNIDGNYIIKNIPFGTYNITASYVGFSSQTKKIVLDTNNQNLNIDFLLSENTQNLDQVIISADSKETQIENKGFAVEAIETSELRLQSIQMNDLLKQTSGVIVRQDGGLGSRVTYNINGLSGNAIRFFLDGIPMEYFGSSYSLSSIPSSLIERMDVYKGVVPAELGNDALGGAVNIITKNAKNNSLEASFSYGSFNTQQFSLNGNWRDKTTGITTRGSIFYNYSDNNYKVWGDEVFITNPETLEVIRGVEVERFHDAYKSYGSKIDFGFTNVKWADQAFISLLYSNLDKDVQHGSNMEVPFGERRYEQSFIMPNITYLKKDFITKNLDINLFGSYSDLKRKIIDTTSNMYDWKGSIVGEWAGGGEAGSPTLNESKEKVFISRINLLYSLNKNNKVSGNYVRSDFNRTGDDPIASPEIRNIGDKQELTKHIFGFTYENVSFNENLKTSLFFKYYKNSIHVTDAIYEAPNFVPYFFNKKDNNTGYGIALSYKILKKILITSSLEDATRIPVAQEVFGNGAENIDPSYSLAPEQSLNANIGFKIGPFYVKKHTFGFNFNGFLRNTANLIQRSDSGNTIDTFIFENIGEVKSLGFDSELKYTYNDKLHWRFSTSILDSRNKVKYDDNGNEVFHYNARLKNTPYFKFNNNIKYNLNNLFQENSKIFIHYNIGYIHEFFRYWETFGGQGKDKIPSQLVHNIGLSYTFPNQNISLSFDAKNILNEQAFDNFAIQKPGRAFYFKINYKI